MDWIILRCAGRNTLPLADSLRQFEAWTPAKVETRRVLRSRTRVEFRAPLLPNFVFAPAGHVEALSDIANAERSPYPDFSLFHFLDRIPVVADRELDALRHEEAREQRRSASKERRSFSNGQAVSTRAAGFEGMSGIVEKANGKFVWVLFDGRQVKIASFLLQSGEGRMAA